MAFVAAMSVGGLALDRLGVPVSAAEGQPLAVPGLRRTGAGHASGSQLRAQPAPEEGKASPSAHASKAPKTPAQTKAPASSAAPAGPTAPAAPAAKELAYQFRWQENYYFCGPAAARIALTARNLYPSQSQIANSLGTTVNGTGSAADTTRALNALGNTSFYKSRFIPGALATQAEIDRLRADVVNAIINGYAVVANIAGYTTDTNGTVHSYLGGHYLTVVGYVDGGQTVKIADPADALGRGWYLLSAAKLANWIAQRGYSA